MLLGGGLCGFLAVKMLDVGAFALGAALGVAIAVALKAVLWGRIFPSSPRAGFIAGCLVLGLAFGMLALALRRQMLILSTAYAGSFAFFFGIGHFLGHFPTVDDLGHVENGEFNPWTVTYLALTLLLGTAGLIVQLRVTEDKPLAYGDASGRHQQLRASESASSGDESEWERAMLIASQRTDPRDRSPGRTSSAPTTTAADGPAPSAEQGGTGASPDNSNLRAASDDQAVIRTQFVESTSAETSSGKSRDTPALAQDGSPTAVDDSSPHQTSTRN
jgi:hypothetical protein